MNESVAPKTDLEQYGKEDWWTIPDAAGDCEDYVLLKLIRLLYQQFHPTQFHILVVKDEKGEGHAVLGVDVFDNDNGTWNTLVLDNKTDEIITLDAMERKYKGLFVSFVVEREDGRLEVRFSLYPLQRE